MVLIRRYVHYFHTLTTVCERCIHTFCLCPRWRSAHPFLLEIQPNPAHFTRPSRCCPSCLSLGAVRFSSKPTSQSIRPDSHEPASPLHPARASQKGRVPDSLNPLVYFHFCPGPRSQPRAIVACLSGCRWRAHIVRRLTHNNQAGPRITKIPCDLSAALADRHIMAYALW